MKICIIFQVNPEESVQVEIRIENFVTCSNVVIPVSSSEFSCRIKLEDSKRRKLYVTAEILINRGAKYKVSKRHVSGKCAITFYCMQINISAPFWIINKTGLPLVFKQSGTSGECAGQFDDHEQARMISPLLFSFSDSDASNTLNARVGKRVVWDGVSQVRVVIQKNLLCDVVSRNLYQ